MDNVNVVYVFVVDSIHVAPRAHRRIAEALTPTLATMLRARR